MNKEYILPTDPVTRDKIKKVVIDLSNQQAIIDGHKSAMNEGAKSAAEDFEMPLKYLKKMVKAYSAQNIETQQQEFDEFIDLYGAVFKTTEEDETE